MARGPLSRAQNNNPLEQPTTERDNPSRSPPLTPSLHRVEGSKRLSNYHPFLFQRREVDLFISTLVIVRRWGRGGRGPWATSPARLRKGP